MRNCTRKEGATSVNLTGNYGAIRLDHHEKTVEQQTVRIKLLRKGRSDGKNAYLTTPLRVQRMFVLQRFL